MLTPSPAAPWPALLPAALAGTYRQPFAPLPGLSPPLGAEAHAPEKQLLLTAANLALVHRAGQRPLAAPAQTPPAAPREQRPRMGAASARLFGQVLERGDHRAYAYCLAALDWHGRCLPPHLLEPALALLHRYAHVDGHSPLREPFSWLLFLHARAFGARGIWLAALLRERYPSLDSSQTLAQGAFVELAHSPLARYEYWAELLTRRPALARRHLLREWPHETTEFRQGVLWHLWATGREINLPPPYDAQLRDLLARQVPPDWVAIYQGMNSQVRTQGTPLAERLWSRARQWLTYVPPTADAPGHLHATLPTRWDPTWAADGLCEWQPDGQPKYPGGQGGSWLAQHLAWLPPSRWAAAWHLTLPELITLADQAEQSTLLLLAWLQAAVNTRDLPAARALLDHLATRRSHGWFGVLVPPVVRLLPLAEQRAWLHRVVPARPGSAASAHWASWLDALYPELPGTLAEALPVMAAILDHTPRPGSNQPASQLLPLLNQLPYRGEDNLRPAVLATLGPLQARHPSLASLISNLLTALAWREEFVAGVVAPGVGW